MTRRGFLGACVAAVGAMLLPAAKAAGVEPLRFYRAKITFTPRLDEEVSNPIYKLDWKELPIKPVSSDGWFMSGHDDPTNFEYAK